MKVAIAIAHGMGSDSRGFSFALQRGIAKHYQSLGLKHKWQELIFQEILWSDILAPTQKRLLEKMCYTGLRYSKFRRFFIEYLGDVIAYQPLCEKEGVSFQDKIQKRLEDSLTSFNQVPEFDNQKTPLVLIGHSLGSVVLLDHLIHNQNIEHENPFLCGYTLCGLITLGSPLALWSLRYKDFGKPFTFPGQALSKDLVTKAKWLNLYDKDDVIAYPLKPINAAWAKSVTEDIAVNVGGFLSFWNPLSHMGYFSSKAVYKIIANFLSSIV